MWVTITFIFSLFVIPSYSKVYVLKLALGFKAFLERFSRRDAFQTEMKRANPP